MGRSSRAELERELEKDRKNERVGKRKALQVHLPSSSIAIYWATWAQERDQACIPLFLRGRSPCNLTLPVINYLPWLSPFTVNAQKAPIASLWAIKASIGWYQTTLTSSNLSCHCHLLKGLLHFVPRVQLLSVCMMQAEYILLATGSFQSFILSNINKVKGQLDWKFYFCLFFF